MKPWTLCVCCALAIGLAPPMLAQERSKPCVDVVAMVPGQGTALGATIFHPVQATVCYADLNPDMPQDAALLVERIVGAVQGACAGKHPWPGNAKKIAACRSDAVTEVVQNLTPAVRQAWQDRR